MSFINEKILLFTSLIPHNSLRKIAVMHGHDKCASCWSAAANYHPTTKAVKDILQIWLLADSKMSERNRGIIRVTMTPTAVVPLKK